MRVTSLAPAALLLLVLAARADAREWIEYNSRVDFFSVNFPGEPTITTTNYTSEYGLTLPARVYSYQDGPNRYSVTVVDYTNAQKLHTERVEQCKAAGGDGDSCNNPWANDVRGAIVHAVFGLITRDGVKVTHLANYAADLVEGESLQLTNADKSRTYAAIHLHEYRLYIFEGTVAAGQPPPVLFQQSLGFLDKDGKRIRYASTYTHGFPVPPRAR